MLTTKPTKKPSDLISHITVNYPNITVNSNKTSSYLTFINYDLLKPYLELNKTKSLDIEQLVKYYDLDRKLKLLLWDGLERIEIAVKTVLMNTMFEKSGDEQWIFDESNYRILNSIHLASTSDKNSFEAVVRKLINFLDSNKNNLLSFLKNNPSVITFQDTYWSHYIDFLAFCNKKTPNPNNELDYTVVSSFKPYHRLSPFIMSNISNGSSKIQDFFNSKTPSINKYELLGFLCKIIKLPFYLIIKDLTFFEIELIIISLKPDHQKNIASIFSNFISGTEFADHVHNIRKLRNIIAHHQPLCNCSLPIIKNFSHFKKYNGNEINKYCELVIFYLDLITKRSTLKDKIEKLITSYHERYKIDFTHLGFSIPPFEI